MTEANKLFGQSLSSYDAQQRAAKDASISQEEFAEASKNAQATWDKFNLILEAFAVNMEPVVTWLGTVADWILEVQEDMDGWFGIIVLVISGLVLFASTVATAALGMVGISAAAGPAAVGIKATGAAAKSAGQGMLLAAPGILAFGAAILGILVGVKLAAEGLSELVRAFEGLNPAQLKAVENALLGFAVTLGLIMIGLVALGAIVQGPILAGVLAIGFAMLMIGAGVYLAATGMASFTDAVGRNIEAIVTLITILPLFLMSLNGLVVLAIPAFAALMMIAYGFAAIAVALWAMPMDELAAMSEMMKAMAELGKEEVSTRVKVTVKEVLDAVSGIDEDKAWAATDLVRAVQEYNLAAAEAGPNGANLMRELQATLEALRAGGTAAGRGGAQPISGGRIAGDVYFNEKLVGKWEERTKTKKWSI
jgi:hypothetical protein